MKVTEVNISTVNSLSSGSPFCVLKELGNCDLMILYAQKPGQVMTMWYKFHLAQVGGGGERPQLILTVVWMGKVSAIMRCCNSHLNVRPSAKKKSYL